MKQIDPPALVGLSDRLGHADAAIRIAGRICPYPTTRMGFPGPRAPASLKPALIFYHM